MCEASGRLLEQGPRVGIEAPGPLLCRVRRGLSSVRRAALTGKAAGPGTGARHGGMSSAVHRTGRHLDPGESRCLPRVGEHRW